MLIKNDLQVKTAPAGLHRVDGVTGLYLKKGVEGGSWIYRYRTGEGKRPEMGLGSIGDIALARARKLVIEFAAQKIRGKDPAAARRRERAEAEAREKENAKRITFAEAAEDYADRRAAEGAADRWRHRWARTNWLGPLKRYAYPVIGDLVLDDIKLPHVTAVLDAAAKVRRDGQEATGATAKLLRQKIEIILDDAVRRGRRDPELRNPADAGLHRGVGRRKGERAHYRRLELDQARSAFQAILKGAQNSVALPAWIFMALTAARPTEAREAKWSEIDLGEKSWTIPKSRTKSGRPHVVPLSALALQMLERQVLVRRSDAIFPGRDALSISKGTLADAPMRDLGVDAGTPHSWRSVFRDACGDRLRVDRDLAEAALSHTLGPVEGAYRRETAIEARRPVMEAYAQWLVGEGANVIAFPARA
jgi:integrase